MAYSSRHVCVLFGVAPETVRNWTEEFLRYLSPTANPGKGRHRGFSEEDMKVFALIADMKKQGRVYDDIHAALRNGQRGEAPALPADEMQALLITDQKHEFALQIQRLETEIGRLQQERDEVVSQLQPTRDENIRLQARLEAAQERIQALSEQLEKERRRVEDLNREVGRYMPKE
jgi:DNA-binding transcriptional MerR regulator